MNKGITVEQLCYALINQVKKGNGKKYVLVSDDDEGNGYHTLFDGVCDNLDDMQYVVTMEHDSHKANEIIVLC